MKSSLKYLKLFENRWNWPKAKRLYSLGLLEPDLFNCWTRVPKSLGIEPREAESLLSGWAEAEGVMLNYAGEGTDIQTLTMFKWVGPVEGLKNFVSRIHDRWPHTVTVWGWGRCRDDYHAREIEEWQEWANNS